MKRIFAILLGLVFLALPFGANIMKGSAAAETKADYEAAFKRPAYASSLAADDSGWTEYLTDGKSAVSDNIFSTKPKSAQGAEWVEVDLIGEINIRSVTIHFSSVCAPSDFTVDVWNGSKWVNLSSNKDYKYNGAALTISPVYRVNGSKVRLNASKLTKNSGGLYALQLIELMVRGYASGNYYSHIPNGTASNIAANAVVNVSGSFENYGTYANHLTDSSGTVWSSNVFNKDTNEAWAEVMLDAVYSVNSVTLRPRYEREVIGFPKDFKISIWNNGAWTDVVSKTNYTAPANGTIPAFTFGAVSGSRIRVTATRLSAVDNVTTFNFQLAEISAAGAYQKELTAVAPDNSLVGSRVLNPDFGNDIALNKPVSSFTDWSQWSGPILNINDGVLTGYFSSNGNTYDPEKPEWVEINLLDNYEIEKVVLYGRPNNYGLPIDFTISVFYDGKWIDVVKETGYTTAISSSVTENIFTFKKTVGNKIRVTATKMNPDSTGFTVLQLVELCAYGAVAEGDYVMSNENLISPINEVTAGNPLEDWGFFTDMLVDGSLTTGYSSVPTDKQSTEEWVEINLNMTVRLSELQLKPARFGDGFPVDFAISLYDGGTWTEVINKKGFATPANEAMQIFRFTKRPASRIKITATKLGSDYGRYDLKLNEVMAFAFQGAVVDDSGNIVNNTTSPDSGFKDTGGSGNSGNTGEDEAPGDSDNSGDNIHYEDNDDSVGDNGYYDYDYEDIDYDTGTEDDGTGDGDVKGTGGSTILKVPKQLAGKSTGIKILLFVGIGLLILSAGGGVLFYILMMKKAKSIIPAPDNSEFGGGIQ